MLAGHYAAAYAAKAAQPRLRLWTLFIAAQLVDIFWALLVLAGVERAGLNYSLPSNPLVGEYMPYSHSLLGTAVFAGVTGLLAWTFLGERKGAAIIALVVLSHWFLDLPMHRADLTLAGGDHKLGLELWNHPLAAHGLEFVLLGLALVLFLAITRPPARERWAATAMGLLLAGVQVYSIIGPPPKSVTEMVISLLVVYLGVAALAAWFEGNAGRQTTA